MFYREAGEYKTTYAADMAIFPIRQDRYGVALILIVALLVVPAFGVSTRDAFRWWDERQAAPPRPLSAAWTSPAHPSW